MSAVRQAVSVSPGGSKRDRAAELELEGRRVEFERRGTDGDTAAARALFEQLDGEVDALGFGGFELELRVGERRYPLHAGQRLVAGLQHTPVVDGGGLKHTLEIKVPESLPKVNADLLQLEQCIVSLIRNAAEAYENDRGKIRLRVEVLQFHNKVPECVIGELSPGQHLRLSVEDQGEGVHADPPSRIFEPFFSTRFIGRGLGLAVTQQIVRAHDGAIDLRTDPSGTLVSVYLPAITNAP